MLFLIHSVYRFLETAAIIKKNLSLFQSFCEHVDIVTTIIEYLEYYGIKFLIDKFDKFGRYKNMYFIVL